MQFIKHTENWVKGESFEGGMLFIFGLFLLILAFYFWRLAHLPYFKALIVPFLVVGLLWSAAAGIGLYQNTNRLEKFRAEYEKILRNLLEARRIELRASVNGIDHYS